MKVMLRVGLWAALLSCLSACESDAGLDRFVFGCVIDADCPSGQICQAVTSTQAGATTQRACVPAGGDTHVVVTGPDALVSDTVGTDGEADVPVDVPIDTADPELPGDVAVDVPATDVPDDSVADAPETDGPKDVAVDVPQDVAADAPETDAEPDTSVGGPCDSEDFTEEDCACYGILETAGVADTFCDADEEGAQSCVQIEGPAAIHTCEASPDHEGCFQYAELIECELQVPEGMEDTADCYETACSEDEECMVAPAAQTGGDSCACAVVALGHFSGCDMPEGDTLTDGEFGCGEDDGGVPQLYYCQSIVGIDDQVCLYQDEPEGCGTCAQDACDAEEGVCTHADWTGCVIDETCYAAGELNPAMDCQKCDPSGDPGDWWPVAAGTPCLDEDLCDGAETCDGVGGCVAGTPLVCDDGLWCNGLETCNPLTGCVDGEAPPVTDLILCTVDVCNEEMDAIDHSPDGAQCDDKNPCTDDVCDETNGCLNPPKGGLPCDDEEDATVQDVCAADGTCAGTLCGNGVPDDGEDCDDGGSTGDDSCTDACELHPDCVASPLVDTEPQCACFLVLKGLDEDGEVCDVDGETRCAAGGDPAIEICGALDGLGEGCLSWGAPETCLPGTEPLPEQYASCFTEVDCSAGVCTYPTDLVPLDNQGATCDCVLDVLGWAPCLDFLPEWDFECIEVGGGEQSKMCIAAPMPPGVPLIVSGCTMLELEGTSCLAADQCNAAICTPSSGCGQIPAPVGTACDDDSADTVADSCDGAGTCAGTLCGNGVPDDGEACDDGNEVDGDACTNECELHPDCLETSQPINSAEDCACFLAFQALALPPELCGEAGASRCAMADNLEGTQICAPSAEDASCLAWGAAEPCAVTDEPMPSVLKPCFQFSCYEGVCEPPSDLEPFDPMGSTCQCLGDAHTMELCPADVAVGQTHCTDEAGGNFASFDGPFAWHCVGPDSGLGPFQANYWPASLPTFVEGCRFLQDSPEICEGAQCKEPLCAKTTGCGSNPAPEGTLCDDEDEATLADQCVVTGPGTITSCAGTLCGNGVQDDGEACDDGNGDDGDYCSADCLISYGSCGDGVKLAFEGCDDENLKSWDGCDASCQPEDVDCGAIHVNGINQYIELPSMPVEAPLEDFTVAMWTYLEGPNFNFQSFNNLYDSRGWSDQAAGVFGLRLGDAAGVTYVRHFIHHTGADYLDWYVALDNLTGEDGESLKPYGRWVHWALQRKTVGDTTTVTAWVDMVKLTNNFNCPCGTPQNTPMTLGNGGHVGSSNSAANYQDKAVGKMASLAIWRRALSEQELRDMSFEAPTPLDDDLVGYWPFDAVTDEGQGVLTTPDRSGHGYHATLVNGAVDQAVDGDVICATSVVCGDAVVQSGETCDDGNGKSWDGCDSTCQPEDVTCGYVELNGMNQWVTLPPLLDPGEVGDFTIALWAWLEDPSIYGDARSYLIDTRNTSDPKGAGVTMIVDEVDGETVVAHFLATDLPNNQYAKWELSIDDTFGKPYDRWSHWVIQRETVGPVTTVRAWIDMVELPQDQQLGPADGPQNVPFSLENIVVGNYALPVSSGDYNMDGKLGSLAIWSRALTEQELIDHSFAAPTTPEAGLVGYWPFDTTSNKSATQKITPDRSGHAYDAFVVHPAGIEPDEGDDDAICAHTVMCGDGEVGGDEACDDGNLKTGDGCAPGCVAEEGLTCGSIELDGWTDFIDLPDMPDEADIKDFTVAMWVWLDEAAYVTNVGSSSYSYLIDTRPYAVPENWSGLGMRVREYEGVVYASHFLHYEPQTANLTVFDVPLDGYVTTPYGRWSHWVFQRESAGVNNGDPSTLRTWVDMVELPSSITGGPENSWPMKLNHGARVGTALTNTTGDHHINGKVGDLAIWRRALSVEELQAKSYDASVPWDAALVGYWPFDQIDEPALNVLTTPDLSDHGYDATLSIDSPYVSPLDGACTVIPECGNGFIEPGESCDGNVISHGSCLACQVQCTGVWLNKNECPWIGGDLSCQPEVDCKSFSPASEEIYSGESSLVAHDGEHLYRTQWPADTGEIWRVPVVEGPLVSVADGLDEIWAMGAEGGEVFAYTTFGDLVKVDGTGVAEPQLVGSPGDPGGADARVLVDGTHAYVMNHFSIMRYHRETHEEVAVAVADEGGQLFGLAMDEGYVYWAQSTVPFVTGTIERTAKSLLGEVEELVGGLFNPQFVAVDDTHVYWAQGSGLSDEDVWYPEGVHRRALDAESPLENLFQGGAPEDDVVVQGLELQGGYLYFMKDKPMTIASLHRLPVSGGEDPKEIGEQGYPPFEVTEHYVWYPSPNGQVLRSPR